MTTTTQQKILRHRLKAALMYWLWLPGLVIGSGLLLDRGLGLARWQHGPAAIAATVCLLLLGLILIAWSDRDLARLGHGTPSPAAPCHRLVTSGSYRLCRHPMFLGYDLAAFAIVFFTGSPAMILVSYPLLLVWQVRFLKKEEHVLALRFHEDYQAYRAEVPFLIPPAVSEATMIRTLLSLRKLLQAAHEHHEVEDSIQARFRELLEPRYRTVAKPHATRLQYLQKNFFSSLFLSIYGALGIPPARRLLYGQINHCIRGLVTATDNILDDEYKELLPLNFPVPAIRFKSVMHILCFDRILERVCRQAAGDGLIPSLLLDPLLDTIFKAMVPIGAEEALEEGGVTEILTPAAVLASVHMYKGGKLLCLAFTAPILLETERQEALTLAETGIFRIGMALQVIDDLTDFYEDITNRNHNYLVSAVHHEGEAVERERFSSILAQPTGNAEAVEDLFPVTLRRVMAQAIGEALAGFAALKQAGFWYNERQALMIIRFLFTIRGVGHLLPFFPEPGQALRLSSSPHE